MLTIEDFAKAYINDGRESVFPEGKLKVIEQYTKEAMKRVHAKDVDVFFCSFKGSQFEGIKAIHRPSNMPPVNFRDVKRQKPGNSSITYNTDFFNKDKITLEAWIVIMHEITHEEVGIISVKKGEKIYYEHPSNFNEKVQENINKTGDLSHQFMKENGFSEKDLESLVKEPTD